MGRQESEFLTWVTCTGASSPSSRSRPRYRTRGVSWSRVGLSGRRSVTGRPARNPVSRAGRRGGRMTGSTSGGAGQRTRPLLNPGSRNPAGHGQQLNGTTAAANQCVSLAGWRNSRMRSRYGTGRRRRSGRLRSAERTPGMRGTAGLARRRVGPAWKHGTNAAAVNA